MKRIKRPCLVHLCSAIHLAFVSFGVLVSGWKRRRKKNMRIFTFYILIRCEWWFFLFVSFWLFTNSWIVFASLIFIHVARPTYVVKKNTYKSPIYFHLTSYIVAYRSCVDTNRTQVEFVMYTMLLLLYFSLIEALFHCLAEMDSSVANKRGKKEGKQTSSRYNP